MFGWSPGGAPGAQLTLCVNAVYLVVLSTTTLPLYSLTVHMGSDYKRALLPPDICAHLDAAADQVWRWAATDVKPLA